MEYNIIYSHSVGPSKVIPDEKEILRYMGQRGRADGITEALVAEVVPLTLEKAVPKGAFVVKKVAVADSAVYIDEVKISSQNLSKNLSGCESVILFALTSGARIDRLIGAHSALSPAKALAISATATAITEKYADVICKELKEYYKSSALYLRPRFSPGYGDFSLEFQDYIITQTDATRRCGIALTDTMMLTPSKSVTGIIGISSHNSGCVLSGCEACTKTDCRYRR